MKNRSVTLSLLTATLFAIPALAADVPAAAPTPPPPGQGPQGPWREEIMKRFDQDKDGQLNDAERAAARAARKEMGEGLKKKFDRNNDGQLDDSERAAAREAMRGKWGKHQGRGFAGPRGPGRPPEWMRRELHHWFAQQWGGVGGPGARFHQGHGGKRTMRGPLHARIMQRFDQDKDGKLSDTERAGLKQAAEERRARREQHRKDVLARFDQDGDGKLGDTERKGMQDAWQKFLQQQPVLKPAAK
jgi:hypothetical protein